MGCVALPPFPLWAVHISDGVLSLPWLVGGFVVAAGLMLLGSFRVRDEEIPRIALLAAAFFVASLIHVRVGPTSVHLLLNGLVGVLLGRRAALAIPLGLFLQAALIGHGGYTTLGVNSCVLTLPALFAGVLYATLVRLPGVRQRWFRTGLVAVATFLSLVGIVFCVVLLATNRLGSLAFVDVSPAEAVAFHPATLGVSALLALTAAWLERRLDHAPEFPLGLLVGVSTVLLTLSLNAITLLWGGAEDWHSLVVLVFVAHLPIAVLEGIVLGFTVAFLSRVKPELLGSYAGHWREDAPHPPAEGHEAGYFAPPSREIQQAPAAEARERGKIALPPPALLLALAAGVLFAGNAQAHRLEAECKVLPGNKVRVESWFDLTGESPVGAAVQVFRPGKELLTEGKLDEKGLFVFPFTRAEDLTVVVSAGAGHRKEVTIPRADLMKAQSDEQPPESTNGSGQPDKESAVPLSSRATRIEIKDILTGLALLLAMAAFALAWRNARMLEALKRQRREG
jgi:cobalt/nickel transport system permease protein